MLHVDVSKCEGWLGWLCPILHGNRCICFAQCMPWKQYYWWQSYIRLTCIVSLKNSTQPKHLAYYLAFNVTKITSKIKRKRKKERKMNNHQHTKLKSKIRTSKRYKIWWAPCTCLLCDQQRFSTKWFPLVKLWQQLLSEVYWFTYGTVFWSFLRYSVYFSADVVSILCL